MTVTAQLSCDWLPVGPARTAASRIAGVRLLVVNASDEPSIEEAFVILRRAARRRRPGYERPRDRLR